MHVIDNLCQDASIVHVAGFMSSGYTGLGCLQSAQLFVQAAFTSMLQSFILTTSIIYMPCLQRTPTTSTSLSTTVSSQLAPSTVCPMLLPLTMSTAPMSLWLLVPSSLVDLTTPPRVSTSFCSTSVLRFSSLLDPAYSFLQVPSVMPMLLSSLTKQAILHPVLSRWVTALDGLQLQDCECFFRECQAAT